MKKKASNCALLGQYPDNMGIIPTMAQRRDVIPTLDQPPGGRLSIKMASYQ